METPQWNRVAANIRNELRNYVISNDLKALVIGESGGIDSALCSVLAAPVCRELGIQLIGRSITIETNKADEIARGQAIGDQFCTDFKAVDLTALYLQTRNCIEMEDEGTLTEKLRKGNVKARLRMIYLFDLAQKHKGLVLSTDNYTELLLGFWTLHGDVGDYGMIQNLWKIEVYALAQYLVNNELQTEAQKQALKSCILATPTDGLGITNSDLDQLGAASYAEVDKILQDYQQGKTQDLNNPVIQRHLRSEYKRNNPLNLSREAIMK